MADFVGRPSISDACEASRCRLRSHSNTVANAITHNTSNVAKPAMSVEFAFPRVSRLQRIGKGKVSITNNTLDSPY
jgi:hypothetical protein